MRDLLAELLTETCHNFEVEPRLQPLNGESFHQRSTSTAEGARLDIKAGGFWGSSRHEVAYFDVWVFNPHANSYRSLSLEKIYRQDEAQKRRVYEQRVREVDNGSFTPLIFSCTGGSSPATTVFLKRLGSSVADKRDVSYATTMGWLRCRLSFPLLRANMLCLRGSRPVSRHLSTTESHRTILNS